MSYESASKGQFGILSSIGGIFSVWRRTERAQYAHPWTAYSPANFRPCETVKVDLTASIIEQQGTVLPVRIKDTEKTSTVLQIEQSSKDQTSAVTEAVEASKPTPLRLISSKDWAQAQPKPVLPGLAASTGRDFQLAARLRSVSVLNRKSAPLATARTVKSTSINRPVKQPVAGKRSRHIEPPAVGRQTRTSAEIVQLELTLARVERKRAKTLKIA